MSSGKGSASQTSRNYYGTLAGAISWGPWDWLDAIIANGNYVFKSHISLTSDVTDLTGSLIDPSLLAPGGYLKLYRGTETQTADPALPGHPPMKGTVWLAAKSIFFGQNSGTAPNLQVIGGGLPRVPTSIVAEEHNFEDDGQINPIAAYAEILLDERGAGMAESELDADSWLASAAWCAQNKEHRDFTFCSPLFNQQLKLRDIARQLLDPHNGFCCWTKSGKLACRVYEWGSDPGGVPVLDARHWVTKPKETWGGWSNVPTELIVSFTDREFEYQGNTVAVPNARAQQIRKVDDPKTLERKTTITRSLQAHKQALETLRRVATAPSKFPIEIRAPFADNLTVGDKVYVDTDPEPGGGGLAQLARVDHIKRSRSGAATLRVQTDNLLPAIPYAADWAPPSYEDEVSPALEHYLGVPLPPNVWGWPPNIGILATRPAGIVDGFHVFFGYDEEEPFADLGPQFSFAVRAQLAGAIEADDTVLSFDQIDGLDAPDAVLAANTPGGNTTEAANDMLLALITVLDEHGRIPLKEDGDPDMEFVSIVSREVNEGAVFDYTVLRGRRGTSAKAWADGATVWIVPRFNLIGWDHALLTSPLTEVGLFRLVSFTAHAVDESTPVPECAVNLIPMTAPSYRDAVVGYTDYRFKRAAIEPATPTGNNPVGWSDGPPSGTDPLWMVAGDKTTSGELIGTWSDPVLLTGEAGDYLDYVFKRASTKPSAPTGDGLPSGWSDGPPAGSEALWVSTGLKTASDILIGTWSEPVRLDGAPGANGTPGVNGTDGVDGEDGKWVEFVWKRASTQPSAPTGNGIPSGWYDDPPAGSDPLWMSKAKQELDGTLVAGESWSTPIRHDGPPGANGTPGVNGTDGVDGEDGKWVEFVWKRASTQPSAPTGNGIPSGWYDDPPAGSDPLWMSKAKQELDGTLVAGESWSTPIRHDGPPGANGDDGASAQVQYSVNGSSSWHDTFNGSADLYMRVRVGSGDWSSAIRIVGENGTNGESMQVEYSVTGTGSWHFPFEAGDHYMRQRIGSSGTWSAAIKIVGEDAGGGGDPPGTAVQGADQTYSDGADHEVLSVTVNTGARPIQVSGGVDGELIVDTQGFQMWITVNGTTAATDGTIVSNNTYRAKMLGQVVAPSGNYTVKLWIKGLDTGDGINYKARLGHLLVL